MPNAYSESTLATFESCARALHYKRKRLVASTSRPLDLGKLGHNGIEAYLGALRESGLPQDAGIIPSVAAKLTLDKGVAPAEDLRAEAKELLETFAGSYLFENREGTVIEAALAFDDEWSRCGWEDWSICRFRGKLDLMEPLGDDVVRVTDWKTGFKVPSRAELEAGTQLRTYAFLTSLLFPKATEFRLVYFYVRSRWAHEFILHREELEDVREDLERRMSRADAETDFKASPGDQCEGCFYRRHCDAYRKAGRDEIPEETEALATAYYLLKARLKDVETALKKRVETEGAVSVSGGKELNYYPVESWSIDDVKRTIGKLLELGVEPDRVYDEITLSKAALTRLLKSVNKKDELDDFLTRFGSVSARNRFEARKVQG